MKMKNADISYDQNGNFRKFGIQMQISILSVFDINRSKTLIAVICKKTT